MAKVLTHAAVAKYRPTSKRREIPDGGSPGLYLIIQPSGVKSWALRYRRPSGKGAKLTLGSVDLSGREPEGEPKVGDPLSLVAARALASDQLRALKRGVDVGAVHVAQKRHQREAVANAAINSYSALARLFIDQHARKHTRHWQESAVLLGLDFPEQGEPIIRPRSLAARWKDRELRSITNDELHDVIVEAQRDGVPGRDTRGRGPNDSRARALAAALSSFFSWARAKRHVSADPTIGLDKPAQGKARDRVLNTKPDVRRADELRWFWQACAEVPEPYSIVLRLLLLTGARRDELAKLTEDEVSDDLATIRLSGDRTKNHRPHEIYLSALAVTLLQSVKRIAGSHYLFTTNGTAPVTSWSRVKRDLDQAMLRLARQERGEDFTIPPFRIHDVRRTASTGMHAIGVPPHVVEAVIGHVSGFKSGVAGVYNAHAYESERRAALSRWADHIQSVISNGGQSNVVPFSSQG
jgi:integrase